MPEKLKHTLEFACLLFHSVMNCLPFYSQNVSHFMFHVEINIVFSSIQKFRLHARRLPASAVPPANQSSVVVLGGLLVPQDPYADSSKACSSQSGSPQGPLQLAGTGGDSMEEEEDVKSESYCWKSRIQKPGNEDV